MRARTLDEIRVYRKALTAADAISALLNRPIFSKDSDLKRQLSKSSGCIAPLIAEGFGQLTDRHVAVYLGRARGSVLETLAHLRKAVSQGFIRSNEESELAEIYDHIGRMLTRWIKYLQKTDWRDRR